MEDKYRHREVYKKSVDFTPGGRSKESKIQRFVGDDELKKLLVNQLKRVVVKLFKNQLIQLEDLQEEHRSNLKRVEDLVSEDFIKMIDFLDEERCGYYRKRILDSGNEAAREMERLLENFEIQIKK